MNKLTMRRADSGAALDSDISLRMFILRYLMICGIVVLHIPPYVPLSESGSDLISWTKAFFSHGVFRSTVPVLTCISGYLLFSSGIDQNFKRLFAKKTKGILVPLIIWNLPLVALIYIIQSLELSSHQFSATLYPFDWLAWLNGIFGLFAAPVNYPLNFLRDLYVLALLAPIFGIILRRIPYIGLVLVAIIFLNDLDDQLLLRNTMAVNFYIGGLAAVLCWNLRYLDRYALWLFFVFLAFCAAIVIFQIEDRRWFTIIAPFMIWPLSSVIAKSWLGYRISKLAKYSFFVFLSHGPILLLISIIYGNLIGDLNSLAFWLAAPIATITAAHFAYWLLSFRNPLILNFIIGGRG